ncbi:hypothetical protein [Cysteiniphilum halobium]|uniref:hypothetical protein n=1 Tax=Cysteiniphilum halobium TaxID=2219059 RepID=UPI000E6545E9|nr:hypothetical protein [Cysteiniphilum halobium]
MANQYSGSLKLILEAKHNKSLELIFKEFVQKGFTYNDVCTLTGFKYSTVRKWADYCNVKLAHVKSSVESVKKEITTKHSSVIDMLRTKEINRVNALSREWQ